MIKWEYLVMAGDSIDNKNLNLLGREGWEWIQMLNVNPPGGGPAPGFLLKRRTSWVRNLKTRIKNLWTRSQAEQKAGS